MSRTYRRRGERHQYGWVLRDHRSVNGAPVLFLIDQRSKEGRRDRPRSPKDTGQLRRWLDDPGYSPVFQARHRHSAN
ncbi:MAG TPA: hypothetical protein VFB20_08405 [Burkholderiales bacterium]|nr:hypothetical protein [Burkholderiales bacterium]